jgi:2-isopropylmalate synthase
VNVRLLDSTLREGEQTPGVDFSLEQKLDIARRLDAFGIEYIEAGHPAVSPEIYEAVRSVAALGLNAEIVAHSRAMKPDIDLGMAVANSFAAVEAGAEVVDVTVNGLGERTGIAPLAETAVALKLRAGAGNPWKLDMLPELSQLVEGHSRIPLWKQAPIVGANAFTHNAGLHVAAVLMRPDHYESIPAELVGRTRRLVVDKMAGRPTVKYRLEALGLDASDEMVDAVLSYVKRRSINDASDMDLRRIHEDIVALREIVHRMTPVEAR